MANNPYVNKVVYGNDVVMDITDTTAEAADVASGKKFYNRSGAPTLGTGTGGNVEWGDIDGTLSDQTDLSTELAKKYDENDTAETDIQDTDYVPFYDTSATAKKKSLWSNIKAKLNEIFFTHSENNILGAKNLLKYPYSLATKYFNGITYTIKNDGTVDVSGTATALSYIHLLSKGYDDEWAEMLSNKRVIMSGSTVENPRIQFAWEINGETTVQYCRDAEEPEFTVPDLSQATLWYVGIFVSSGVAISGTINVKPMIRLATDPDGTYQPFALTNKQITDKFGTLGSASTKDVPASGDAGQTEVVLGSDTRLTDARTPTSHTHTTSEITDFPTLAAVATSGNYSDLTGTPTIPDELADLSDDSTHRLVTDTEKSAWNDKCDTSVVAPVENGTTASKRYEIGNHFIKDGYFCTAIAVIAQGATLTLNTNYTQGDIAGAISGQIKVVQKTYDVPSASQSLPPMANLVITKDVNDETGYKPIGIVGIEKWGASSNEALISRFMINSSLQAVTQIENQGGNNATVTKVFFDILYIKV